LTLFIKALPMSISDPANLIHRIPELQTLADDHKIRRAIESGDSFKVYRALLMAKLFRRLPKQRDLISMLTNERRLFAKPLLNAPSPTKSKFISFNFIGGNEHDSDGSYIAMRALVIFSKWPLIPLGSFVVKSTGKQQWQAVARAPLGIKGWLGTCGLALGLATLVLSSAVLGYHRTHTQDIILLNGFDLPVVVTLDGENIKLPPQGIISTTVKTGRAHGTAAVDKIGIIDDFDQDIVSNDGTTIWNIAGATPLLHPTVVSGKSGTDAESKNAASVYCGRRFIELEMKLSASKITLAKTASETGPVGIAMCIKYAAENGREKTIAPALEAQALIYDWSLSYTIDAIAAAKLVSQAEAIRVATRAVQAKPGQSEYERIYQDLRDEAGEHDALLREYFERAKQQPDSASVQFLYASLLSGPAGVAAMQELNRLFPQDADILHSLVVRKMLHDDTAGAYRDLVQLRKLSPKHADRLLDTEVRILLAEHRGIEALQVLNNAVRDKAAAKRPDHAADFALVAKQINAKPDFWLKELPAAERNADLLDFYRVRAGLRPLQTQDTQSAFVKLALALRNDPAEALKISKRMNRHQLSFLATDQLSLLYGEAIRTKDAGLVAMMEGMLPLSKAKTKLLEEFLTGGQVNLDELDIDLDIQSAARFIRSRDPQLTAKERAVLRSQAEKTDFLLGPVTTALHQWPN
jgi:hypothetical protein